MTRTRYDNRQKMRNNAEQYRSYFDKRNVKHINQYNTPELSYPSREQLRDITTVQHIWTSGDSYWKLAAEHYGDPKVWWVIAFYNQKPTEFHVQLGEQINIPYPLDRIITLLTIG
jgi:nucleoid-associated protein YgaU